MLRTVLVLLSSWQGNFGRLRNAVIWQVVPYCLFWCLWRERNACHFEDNGRTIPDLKLQFFHLLYEWIKGLGVFSINSLEELMDLCIPSIKFSYLYEKKDCCMSGLES